MLVVVSVILVLLLSLIPLAYAQPIGIQTVRASPIGSIILFVISLIVSTIIIYVVTKLFGEKEGIGRAFLTAIIGTIVYSISYFLFGNSWLASIVGGFVWLIALRGLYDIGWLKALGIAVIVWIAATLVGFVLPTATGPL